MFTIKTKPTAQPKRRSRILSIQKKNLVSLVENFFIRLHGHCSSVNFEEINMTNWQRIASILNTMGPPKGADQWKNSFYFMKNRIRKKVEVIKKYGGHPRDNLSDLDFKIYDMSPVDNYAIEEVFDGTQTSNLDENLGNDEILTSLEDNAADDLDDMNGANEIYLDNNFADLNSLTDYDKVDQGNEDVGGLTKTLVMESAEELEAYMNEPVIEEEILPEIEDIEEQTVDESNDCYGYPHADAESPPSLDNRVSSSYTTAQVSVRRQTSGNFSSGSHTFGQGNEFADVNQLQGTVTKILTPVSNKPAEAAKLSVRIPEVQKERLVQLIQNNFFKAVGQFVGVNGKQIKSSFWKTVAIELNTLGPPRSAEQWKTTFNNIKAGAKSKLADNHNVPANVPQKNLTRLEEKIVSIFGMDNMDGHQSLGESGFRYAETVPQVRRTETPPARNHTNVQQMEFGQDAPTPLVCRTETPKARENANIEQIEFEREVLREIIEEIRSEPNETEHQQTSERNLCRPSNYEENSTVVSSRPISVNMSRPDSFGISRLGRASSRAERDLISRPETDSSRPKGVNTLRSESFGNSRLERASSRAERDLISRPETDSSRPEGVNTLRSVSFGNSRLETSSSRAERDLISRTETDTSPSERGGPSHRQGSSFEPPRVRRRVRSPSPVEYITGVNQFFTDGGNESETGSPHSNRRRSIRENQNNGTVARKTRDRSDLRNRHTSHEMVQYSLSAQERFIDDSNRNHAEMLHLTDRNHVEMAGMFTSTLSALVDVAREFVNKL